jgi:hypothetical protein
MRDWRGWGPRGGVRPTAISDVCNWAAGRVRPGCTISSAASPPRFSACDKSQRFGRNVSMLSNHCGAPQCGGSSIVWPGAVPISVVIDIDALYSGLYAITSPPGLATLDPLLAQITASKPRCSTLLITRPVRSRSACGALSTMTPSRYRLGLNPIKPILMKLEHANAAAPLLARKARLQRLKPGYRSVRMRRSKSRPIPPI